jgi:hypothetical protein
MVFPQSIDELPNELRRKLQAKLDTDIQSFLESCTKDRRDKVTQFRDPTYGDATTATSADAEVNPSDKPRFDDSYPTHANYATTMNDHKKVIDNNLLATVNMIMACFDKLEGKTTDLINQVLRLLFKNLSLAYF